MNTKYRPHRRCTSKMFFVPIKWIEIPNHWRNSANKEHADFHHFPEILVLKSHFGASQGKSSRNEPTNGYLNRITFFDVH